MNDGNHMHGLSSIETIEGDMHSIARKYQFPSCSSFCPVRIQSGI
jgi:hypothetical protein